MVPPVGYDYSSINDLYNAFLVTIFNSIDKCIPQKTVTIRSGEPFYIALLDKSLLTKRNRLRRKGRTTDAEIIANKLNHLITEVQCEHYGKLSLTCPKKAVQHTNNTTSNYVNNPPLAQTNLVNNFFRKFSTDNSYNFTDVDN